MANIDPTKLNQIITSKYVLENETFKRDVKSNPKDPIVLEVGDSKQPDFKPQRKIIRWGESKISMRFPEDDKAVVETEGEKIKYIAPDGYEVHQIEKPELSEDGGHEIIAKFNSLQALQGRTTVVDDNYRLVMTTQFKNVVGYKQPPLTQEEIDQGAERPENVINSIAFYHDTKGGMNDSAGMEYKAGKVGHQYRIKVIDAEGNEIWGDQNWLPETNELELLLPKTWLDNAVYPVVVDPTFGYTSVGAGSTVITINTTVYHSIHPSAEAGTVDSISAYGKRYSSSYHPNAKHLLADSSGNLLTNGVSNATSWDSDTLQWFVATMSTPPNISASTNYILGVIFSDYAYLYWDTVTDFGYFRGSNSYTTPANFTPDIRNYKYSIYATYTASGGGTAVKDAIGSGVIPFPR